MSLTTRICLKRLKEQTSECIGRRSLRLLQLLCTFRPENESSPLRMYFYHVCRSVASRYHMTFLLLICLDLPGVF